MKKLMTFLLLLTLLSCDKNLTGVIGFYASGGCQPCELDGTKWRWEGIQYNVSQAWTISFTSTTQCEMWWGDSKNYYQTRSVTGTYTVKGSTVGFTMSTTYSGTGSYKDKYFEGKISGNSLTVEGLTYTKL